MKEEFEIIAYMAQELVRLSAENNVLHNQISELRKEKYDFRNTAPPPPPSAATESEGRKMVEGMSKMLTEPMISAYKNETIAMLRDQDVCKPTNQ